MRTLKQIEAARFNGAKSRGPVPSEGKARVAQNAVRDGIDSKRVVLQNEEPAVFAALRDELLADWNPASIFERDLVIDIAEARWRLRRLTALETAAIDSQIQAMRPAVAKAFESIDEETCTVLAFHQLVVNNRTFDVLQATIRQQHRIIDRAISQLLRLRKLRPDGGEPAPLPPADPSKFADCRTKPGNQPLQMPKQSIRFPQSPRDVTRSSQGTLSMAA